MLRFESPGLSRYQVLSSPQSLELQPELSSKVLSTTEASIRSVDAFVRMRTPVVVGEALPAELPSKLRVPADGPNNAHGLVQQRRRTRRIAARSAGVTHRSYVDFTRTWRET